MRLSPNEPIIDDTSGHDYLIPLVDGEIKGMGAVPRDYTVQPVEMFDPPSSIPLIPRSEWSDRIKEKERQKSRISDILLAAGIPSMDQGPNGYCFPPQTRILMEDHTERCICDVEVGDSVITAEGNARKVTQTMSRAVKEFLHKPILTGHSTLVGTAEHPILTHRGYVQLRDLVPGDGLIFPGGRSHYFGTVLKYLRYTVKVPYDGMVFNLEVDGDHSYIAEGVGVHNCWGHSTVGCVQAVRAINNQPYVPLSAYMVCAIIKKGRNEGGWSGLSAKFLREVGVCSQTLWPQGDRNYQSRDTPEVRANAALHKVSEEWVDLARNVYDQNLTFDQLASCLLMNIPCATDFNHWSHAIMSTDLVEIEPGSFGVRFRNSWGDRWGEKGFGILRGSKAYPDGALAIRVTGGSTT